MTAPQPAPRVSAAQDPAAPSLLPSAAVITAVKTWMAEGLCAQADPDTFYPEKGGEVRHLRMALRICGDCPVRDECLEFALDNNERYGIWGGKTVKQRRKLKLRRYSAGTQAEDPDEMRSAS
ncbi:WhiB family transcriptional regulator [Nocardia sp. IFM 10818]